MGKRYSVKRCSTAVFLLFLVVLCFALVGVVQAEDTVNSQAYTTDTVNSPLNAPDLVTAQVYGANDINMLTTTGQTVGGTIAKNTLWSAQNSPYVVTSTILVGKGYTLTIEPGVVVKFEPGFAMEVDGSLHALGTTDSPIVFTSNNSSPAPGNWGYIKFNDASSDALFNNAGEYVSGCIMKYCKVEYAGKDGANAVLADRAFPLLDNISVKSNAGTGICFSGISSNIREVFVTNCTSSNNGGSGIYINGTDANASKVTVNNNTVSSNHSTGIFVNGTGSSVCKINLNYNTATNNTGVGIYCNKGNATLDHNVVTGNNNGGNEIAASIVSITNCEIKNNLRGYYGAGINITNSTVTVDNNTISGNSTTYGWGGGIYNYAYSGTSTVNIINNRITGNTAAGNGGGIANYSYMDQNGSPRISVATASITNNIISSNMAYGDGGGIYNRSYYNYNWYYYDGYATSTVNITSNTINENTANGNGGAIGNCSKNNSAYPSNSIATVTNSTISGNITLGGGGGIFNSREGSLYDGLVSKVTVNNSTIANNTSNSNGGGILNNNGSNIETISESNVNGNTSAAYGGGICNTYGSTIGAITNTNISNNVAAIDGGGISDGTGSTIKGCTITGNKTENGTGGGITTFGGAINGSNICDNIPYNIFYVHPNGTDLDATQNWWGTEDSGEISNDIYDGYREAKYGKVIFEPYLKKSEHVPYASFTYSVDGPKITFRSTSTDTNNDIVTYTWDFGDGTTSIEKNPLHIYTTGTYRIKLTVKDSLGGTSETAQTLDINVPKPVISVVVEQANIIVGQDFWVDITVKKAVSLYTGTVKLSYDPSIIQVTDTVNGVEINTGQVFSVRDIVNLDNTNGWISLSASRSHDQYGNLGFDGDAVLFKVKFHSMASGTSFLNLSENKLLANPNQIDVKPVEIPSTTTNGSVFVGDSSTGNCTGRVKLEMVPWEVGQSSRNHVGINMALTNLSDETSSSITCVADANGNFSYNQLAPGNYRLIAYKKGYLRTALEITIVAGKITNIDKLILPTGDTNGDNSIDFLDLLNLASTYGLAKDSPNYSLDTDLDGSGKVDLFDLFYLARNFRLAGYAGS